MIIWLAIAHGLGSMAAEAGPDPVVASIRQHYERAYGDLEALRLETLVLQEDPETGRMRKRLQMREAFRPGALCKLTYHFKEDPLSGNADDPERDPVRNRVIIRDGFWLQFWIGRRHLVVDFDRPEPQEGLSLADHYYYVGVGLAPPELRPFLKELPGAVEEVRKTSLATVHDFFLPYALRDSSWQRTGSEAVDGHPCVVLERSLPPVASERLWVDTGLSNAIRRRRIEREDGSYVELHGRDFQSYPTGLAWPRVVRLEEDRKLPLEFRLLDVQFGPPPEDLFEVHLPPGTMVSDKRYDKEYVVAGGQEPLEEVIGHCRRFLASEWVARVSLWRSVLFEWVFPCAPAAVLALGIWMARRHRSAASQTACCAGEGR